MMRLTERSPRGGCACKFPQDTLRDVVTDIGSSESHPDLLIGLSDPDDAAVFRVARAGDGSRCIVSTCDFITPILDSPYDWGVVAASNALSDVYAMGGKPVIALSILAWPAEAGQDLEEMREVLRGAQDTVARAGALIVGGHSIIDDVPKFGLSVTGEVDEDHIIRKGGGKPGDVLVLTKPIGVGVIATAIKRGEATDSAIAAATKHMTRLNRSASEAAVAAGVTGGTDVTGYGLAGHLHEMALRAKLSAVIFEDSVPMIPDAVQLAMAGIVPDGSRRTHQAAITEGWLQPGSTSLESQLLLCDAQTSGGLLLAIAEHDADDLIDALHAAGDLEAAIVGELRGGTPGEVAVVSAREQ